MVSNDAPITGDTYTLEQLLGGDLRIVIPDLQRDYCWGSVQGQQTPKAQVFVSGLVHLFLKGRITPLGMLYGYENPKGSNHIMIIDGQQRITTLYLLIGMLFRRTPTDQLRHLLISDYELLDDREPRLVYQMRTEAMYFLSDLVTNFFLDRNGRLSQIEKSPWYYSAYRSDPTIQGFIGALRLIDEVLEKAATQPGWDFTDFAEFVTHRLTFMYHDLESRQHAEQMFITVNTTGEPLTLPQKFKSLLAAVSPNAQADIEHWQGMENWAWRHRDKSDPSRHTTSDAQLERFLRIWIAHTECSDNEALNPTHFKRIYRYFQAYRTLIRCVPEAIECNASVAEHRFWILPTLAYIRHWHYDRPIKDDDIRLVREFWHLLYNISRYQKATASGSDTKAALALVAKMPTPDLTSLLDGVTGLPDRVFNSETRAELRLLASATDRKRAYSLMKKAQAHPLLCGRVEKVLSWCTPTDEPTNLDSFRRYIELIYELWGTDIARRADLDYLRIALLTLRHPGYPIVRRGETVLTLCWQDYDWQRLMNTCPGVVRQILDRAVWSKVSPKDTLYLMAERFTDRSSPYYFLIKSPATLANCSHRMLLRPSEPFLGYYVQDDTSRSRTVTQWYVEQLPIKLNAKSWSTMRPYGTRCLYSDHRYLNLTVDLYYTPDQREKYRVEVFSRPDASPDKPVPPDIPDLVRAAGYPVRYDRRRNRHCTYLPDAQSVIGLLQNILLKEDIT